MEDVTGKFHNYTIDWDTERIIWSIDGREVRRLNYDEAVPVGGRNYPQTPARVRIGLWAGGDEGNPEGTVEWAGGETDYKKGPFKMEVGAVKIVNKYPATGYWFGDFSGRWQSVVGLEEYGVEERGVAGYEWNGKGEDGGVYGGGGGGNLNWNGARGGDGAPGSPGGSGAPGGHGGDGNGGGGGGGLNGGAPGAPGAPGGYGSYGNAVADGPPAVVSHSGSSSLVKAGMLPAVRGSLLALGLTLVFAALA